MKKLFFYLLKKYSRTEIERFKILEILDSQVKEEYYEQTNFGNVYNYFIEFIMSNNFIKSLSENKEYQHLKVIENGIIDSYNKALKFLEIEKVQKERKEKFKKMKFI